MSRTFLPPELRRTHGDDDWVAGVAGGVARALAVDPLLVRIAFVLLTLTNGIGIVIYGALWLLVPVGDVPASAVRSDGRTVEQAAGVGLVTVGVMLLLRKLGLFFPDQIVWPAALIVVGVAIAWSRLGGRPGDLLDGGRAVVLRLVAGATLLALGVGVFAAQNERLVVATQVLVAVAVTMGGVVLLAGPWIVRLGRQLADERTQRIRADERAEVAAHLHDSVLQTLALIQRRADSPTDTIALARRQERELREWLRGRDPTRAQDTLAGALRALVDEIESDHTVTVEMVVVGDAPTDDDTAALVAVVREAVVNAAKHSGAATVSVYAETTDDELSAFVRDRGSGFDPVAVPDDRRGIAESIIGRVERHGGHVDIVSAPDAGTEVAVTLPHRARVRP